MAKRKNGTGNGNGKRLVTPQSVDQAVKSMCDIMWRGNCNGAIQYVPEMTWILFLRILDEKEVREEREAKEIEDAVYDLKAVNPNRKPDVDDRTPEQLMHIIEAKGREIAETLAALRSMQTA